MKRIDERGAGDERGEIMLEAVIIIVPVLILLFVLLSLSFFFYQEAMIHTMATEIAENIAKNYKFTDLPMESQSLRLGDVNNTKMFRMTFEQKNVNDAHQGRANGYVQDRASFTGMGLHPQSANVSCEIHSTGIGRAYVKVTVSQKTDFFLSGILEMTGVADEETLFSSTVYAECTDFTAYTSLMNFDVYCSSQLSNMQLFDSIGSLWANVKNFALKLIH